MIKKLLMIFLWTVVPTVFAQSLSNEATESNQPVQGQVYILESDFCRNLSFRLPDEFEIDVTEYNFLSSSSLSEFGTSKSFSLGFTDKMHSSLRYNVDIACIENTESPILNESGLVFLNGKTGQWEIDRQGRQKVIDALAESYAKGQTPTPEELEDEEIFQLSAKNGEGWLLVYGILGHKYYLTYTSFCLLDTNNKSAWCGKYRGSSYNDFYLELLLIVQSMEFVD